MKLGTVELNGVAGVNFAAQNRAPFPAIGPSFGGDVAVGLNRYLALTGSYIYDTTGSTHGGIVSASGTASDLMGGLRVAFFASRHMESFLGFSAGDARLGYSGSVSLFGATIHGGISENYFAISPGMGMRFKVASRFGVSCDIRPVYVPELGWYFRETGGIYVRLGALN